MAEKAQAGRGVTAVFFAAVINGDHDLGVFLGLSDVMHRQIGVVGVCAEAIRQGIRIFVLAYVDDSKLFAVLLEVVDLARIGIVFANTGIGKPDTLKVCHGVTHTLDAEIKGVVVAEHNVGHAELDEGIGTSRRGLEVRPHLVDCVFGFGQGALEVNDEAVGRLDYREKIAK